MLVSVSQSHFRDYVILRNSLTCWRGIILDRVDSITELGVVIDIRMSFSRYIAVGKVLAMLGFVKRLSGEFRDPYTLRTLYVSLVGPKLEYASCVWRPFYDVGLPTFIGVPTFIGLPTVLY
jgi:hypothetical protein